MIVISSIITSVNKQRRTLWDEKNTLASFDQECEKARKAVKPALIR